MPILHAHHAVREHPAPVAAPDRQSLAFFLGVAVLGGGNAVAVKLGLHELAPLWSAGLRYVSASVLLFAVVAARRMELPRGRALVGVLLFGLLNMCLAYAFLYWALTEITAGTGMVALSMGPLIVVALAALQHAEPFHRNALIGAAVAIAGTAVVFAESVQVASPWALAALLAGALCIAQATVVLKRFPKVDPVVENAIAMGFGGVAVLAISMFAGETWTVPSEPATILSLVYLVLGGSIVLFWLYIRLVGRAGPTAASYTLLVMPLVTVVIAAFVLGETISVQFVIGGAIILAGVYFGALRRVPGAGV